MTYTNREPSRPNCPSCGRPMLLVRSIPGLGGLPELHVYSCRQCGVSFTTAAEPVGQAGAQAGGRGATV